MTTFQQHANYYDLLYGDKDYDAEADFVSRLIRQQLCAAKTILGLGSGTGLHALAMARRGYNVTGIDLSQNMVERAQKRLANTQLPAGAIVSFAQADMRTVRIKEKFDAVISLFHVMGYQTTSTDFIASMTMAAEHLKPVGGVHFRLLVRARRTEGSAKRSSEMHGRRSHPSHPYRGAYHAS